VLGRKLQRCGAFCGDGFGSEKQGKEAGGNENVGLDKYYCYPLLTWAEFFVDFTALGRSLNRLNRVTVTITTSQPIDFLMTR
jgi:hypothetical protein